MDGSIIQGDDVIITDTFLSDNEEEEKLIKQKAVAQRSGRWGTNKRDDNTAHVGNKNWRGARHANFDEPNGDGASSPEEASIIVKNDNPCEEWENDLDAEEGGGGFFDFGNYLHDVDDGGEEDKQEGSGKKMRSVRSNKVWHDSDDDVMESGSNAPPRIFAAESEDGESLDGEQVEMGNETDEEQLIKNEQSENYLERYIDRVDIETYEGEEQKKNAASTINMEDIYIFDNNEMDSHIKKKKRQNKMNEKNIFLKYYLQKFTFHQIEDKKIRQLVGMPKANLILPVYGSDLYVLQYKERLLTISKKVSFRGRISHVQERNGSAYILMHDNYVRNYNLEKGVVYKNRIHLGNAGRVIPMEIKFFDAGNEEKKGIPQQSSDHLYGISFRRSRKINIYDTRSFDVVKNYEMDYKCIGMNFHQKTNSLFAIDSKGNLYNWCLNTNKLINRVVDNYSVFPSCFSIHGDYLVTGSFSGFLNLFHVDDLLNPIKSFKNLTLPVSNAVFNPQKDCLLYYTKLAKNGIKLIDLHTNYVYCNVPWFNSNVRHNVLAADFFNGGDNLCFSVKPNSFYVYDLFGGGSAS
ncbi:WD repeat-containing protein, putative [Plasmodium vivax]|uniref:WD repeat-containing protein, putative n=1 Tax=Plasmodium vivax TaxID=5855 RepID=A0A565A2S9_PLAVI|nr:WD repeat-containing protein, putative [Plasmodium vivax]